MVRDMLMDDRVESVGREHRREVMHLDDPQSVRRQAIANVRHESRRIVDVVHHRDARHDPGFRGAGDRLEAGGGEEVVHDGDEYGLHREVAAVDAGAGDLDAAGLVLAGLQEAPPGLGGGWHGGLIKVWKNDWPSTSAAGRPNSSSAGSDHLDTEP